MDVVSTNVESVEVRKGGIGDSFNQIDLGTKSVFSGAKGVWKSVKANPVLWGIVMLIVGFIADSKLNNLRIGRSLLHPFVAEQVEAITKANRPEYRDSMFEALSIKSDSTLATVALLKDLFVELPGADSAFNRVHRKRDKKRQEERDADPYASFSVISQIPFCGIPASITN